MWCEGMGQVWGFRQDVDGGLGRMWCGGTGQVWGFRQDEVRGDGPGVGV